MKGLRLGLVIAIVTLVAATGRAEGGAPELGVIIAPARGLIPLESEPKVFRVQVLAADPDSKKGLLMMATILVKAGETKTIDRVQADMRLAGTVTLADESSVNYRVSLFRGGERIASTASAFGPKSNYVLLEP